MIVRLPYFFEMILFLHGDEIKMNYNAFTMFTGLVQAIGKIESLDKTVAGVRVSVSAPFSSDLELGESVAVSGVCLTVISNDDSTFEADVIPETIEMTTFGGISVGKNVNLERALQLGDRLGGHIVQGHVDGVGAVSSIDENEKGWKMVITPPSELIKFIPWKGSITIDGVSLTVSAVTDDSFEVSLVPHTLKETTLGKLQVDDHVNLEVDVLGRYLEQLQK
jgi:riboflavin synthase